MLAAACHTCSSACKRSVHILLTSPPAPPLAACCVQVADIPDVDLSKVGTTQFGSFEVEVVDYTTEYFTTLKASAGADACLGGARPRPAPALHCCRRLRPAVLRMLCITPLHASPVPPPSPLCRRCSTSPPCASS